MSKIVLYRPGARWPLVHHLGGSVVCRDLGFLGERQSLDCGLEESVVYKVPDRLGDDPRMVSDFDRSVPCRVRHVLGKGQRLARDLGDPAAFRVPNSLAGDQRLI